LGLVAENQLGFLAVYYIHGKSLNEFFKLGESKNYSA